LKDFEDNYFWSLPLRIFLAKLTSYAFSVYGPMMKKSPIIVPTKPPTYEKYASILLKLRLKVEVDGDFKKYA
jgi:hypothetical protein